MARKEFSDFGGAKDISPICIENKRITKLGRDWHDSIYFVGGVHGKLGNFDGRHLLAGRCLIIAKHFFSLVRRRFGGNGISSKR